MTLQAFVVPVTVQLFLIVNPPSWCGVIWRLMKPMLAPSFRKKVKVIQETMLDKYLKEGFENFLPDDVESGLVDTEQLCLDFVAFRKYAEKKLDSSLKIESRSQSDTYSLGRTCPSRVSSSSFSSSSRTPSFIRQNSFSNNSVAQSSLSGDGDDASIHCEIQDEEIE